MRGNETDPAGEHGKERQPAVRVLRAGQTLLVNTLGAAPRPSEVESFLREGDESGDPFQLIRKQRWVIGRDISVEQANCVLDVETNQAYLIPTESNGTTEFRFANRADWNDLVGLLQPSAVEIEAVLPAIELSEKQAAVKRGMRLATEQQEGDTAAPAVTGRQAGREKRSRHSGAENWPVVILVGLGLPLCIVLFTWSMSGGRVSEESPASGFRSSVLDDDFESREEHPPAALELASTDADPSVSLISSAHSHRVAASEFYQSAIVELRQARIDRNDLVQSQDARGIAESLLMSAIKEDPSFLSAKTTLACLTLAASEDHDEAVRLLCEVVDERSNDAEARYYLAHILREEGDDQLALAEVNKSINGNPLFGPAYLLRSEILHDSDFVQSASDRFTYAELGGEAQEACIFPWTIRTAHYHSPRTGLRVKYSTEWFVLSHTSEEVGICLERRIPNGTFTLSLVKLSDLDTDQLSGITGESWIPIVVDSFIIDGIKKSNPEFRIISSGTHQMNGVIAPACDIENHALFGRVFLIVRGDSVWAAHCSASNGRAAFERHVESAVAILESIRTSNETQK